MEFSFTPSFFQSGMGWTHFQGLPTERSYALFVKFVHVRAHPLREEGEGGMDCLMLWRERYLAFVATHYVNKCHFTPSPSSVSLLLRRRGHSRGGCDGHCGAGEPGYGARNYPGLWRVPSRQHQHSTDTGGERIASFPDLLEKRKEGLVF